jgi:hypothetical protein
VLTRPVMPSGFEFVPGDREGDRGIQRCAEVIGVVRLLPKVMVVDEQPAANTPLEAGIELVAEAWLYGNCVGTGVGPGTSQLLES